VTSDEDSPRPNAAATAEALRPDGRTPSPELRRLRDAALALRLHLDELPIAIDENVPPDTFLAGLGFMSARHRYDCATSLIGASFGGTVIGAMARSLFSDALRWLWIADAPAERRRALLGDLLQERHRICQTISDSDASCPIVARWLMPIPPVADLTGASMTWVNEGALPPDDDLLNEFLTNAGFAAGQPHERARSLLNVGGLRGAVLVLAHAGHGNYLGLQSALSEDGVPGHDLRPDHEALFIHVAAAGATAALLGVAATVPQLWPSEVDQDLFLDEALRLAVEVADSARKVHNLNSSKTLASAPMPATTAAPARLLHPGAVLKQEDVLPDVNTLEQVAAAAEGYWEAVRIFPFNPWKHGDPSLHEMLNVAGAHSNLEAVLATYDQSGSEVIAPFAARMLLEEAARLHWRFEAAPSEFTARATQYFDEFRTRKTGPSTC
jgi:hypothetical protein